ncbi:hypothetical protein [Sporosarcina pasteurii]|uniref:YneQ n=1 Tax=Sporosarcina pasteurii TaxID=1474 RepID=A0A380BRQ5_SPOPA|nr:hypothetical protein [Sporosarcina pasteurii]MDS9471162.1 hypothetical protein [Sporosarcina pasteurii]QBQ05199.1 hypothetical protein E2C16_05725 [Sporosarcina pasteurii]SUJ05356.1 Uncharacterised protein [Sporosarcina pasteurii]
MAFGINRQELTAWKKAVAAGEIAFLTHYWLDDRFPNCKTVTKAGCGNIERLAEWGEQYGLKREWIDMRDDFPHFDLFGEHEKRILINEGLTDQLKRFNLL